MIPAQGIPQSSLLLHKHLEMEILSHLSAKRPEPPGCSEIRRHLLDIQQSLLLTTTTVESLDDALRHTWTRLLAIASAIPAGKVEHDSLVTILAEFRATG